MKKLKLSLSICMMCLCVAVLCAGILAASSATYNINGNMSYNMIDGVALVNTRVYKVAGTETDLSTQCTILSTKSFEDIERETNPYYMLSQKLDSQPLINTSTDGTSASNTASVDIVYGATDSVVDYYTYYVVIGIKNVSTDTGYVLDAYLNALNTSTISNIASNANGESNSIEIKSGKFSNIVIGLSYTGTTTTFETFSYTLNISYEESGLKLKQDTENSYWYVELGQVSSSDTTKLKWRYVGDYSTSSDGTETFTCYTTYTSTKPTIGSGSVFVQETQIADSTTICYGGNYDYFAGPIRTRLLDGTIFNLNDTEKSYLDNDYIKARKFQTAGYTVQDDDPDWDLIDGKYGFYYPDPRGSVIENTSSDLDYFWLLSVDEACAYFDDVLTYDDREAMGTVHEKIRWGGSGSGKKFLLRNPCCSTVSGTVCLTFMDSLGSFGRASYGGTLSAADIRAAFRLA